MYIPRHHHWIGPTALVLTGFYIHEHVNPAWDVIVFVNMPMAVIALEWGAYIWQAGVAYQNYVTRGGAPASAKPAQTEAKLDPSFTPIVRALPEMKTQIVEAPKFDMERQFAKTLINMHDFKPNDEAVDLREETWKRPNKFGSRDAYLLVRDNWERQGIVAKKDKRKNSRYVVKDWRAVQLIADGNPLPREQ